jgi:hypothetical protein
MADQITELGIDAFLCDSAVTAEGKLYAQGGGWNEIRTPGFPFRQPRMGLGLIVTVPYTATNQNHRLEVQLMSEDGLLPLQTSPDGEKSTLEAQFNLGRPATLQPGDAQVVPFAVNIDGCEFSSPGAFSFVLRLDGTEVKRLTFRVRGNPDVKLSPA